MGLHFPESNSQINYQLDKLGILLVGSWSFKELWWKFYEDEGLV